MHVNDLIYSMIFITKKSKEKISLYNIGPNDTGVTVNFISKQVVKFFKDNKKIIFEKKLEGWKGDVPKFSYSNKKIKKLGLNIRMSSKESVVRAIQELVKKKTIL